MGHLVVLAKCTPDIQTLSVIAAQILKQKKFKLIAVLQPSLASLVAQTVRNPPEKQVTWVQSPGGEDLLEKGMATHSSILAWSISRTEEPNVLHD